MNKKKNKHYPKNHLFSSKEKIDENKYEPLRSMGAGGGGGPRP